MSCTHEELLDGFRGCLLGGAVGDALGGPVEFLSREEIERRFGAQGITDFALAYGRLGAITDDTQMTLFTAEGLIRAAVRYANRGICNPASVVHHAYLRWLKTQGEKPSARVGMDGWLSELEALWYARAPGNTCIWALREATRFGTPADNDSKGCGTVMRTAPVGLLLTPERAFGLGMELSRLTHGHPTATLSAGFLSALIAELVQGRTLPDAISAATDLLRTHSNSQESLQSIEKAQTMALQEPDVPAAIERLGGGWVAEEAVSIALYSVLSTRSFRDAVLRAVNHSGDSDSTGAIAGNIAGLIYGVDAIPVSWLEGLELRDEITAVADDLLALREETLALEDESTSRRYPGW
jgi:ADP-ribosyl-[dinitrogen reductase] hydrolase